MQRKAKWDNKETRKEKKNGENKQKGRGEKGQREADKTKTLKTRQKLASNVQTQSGQTMATFSLFVDRLTHGRVYMNKTISWKVKSAPSRLIFLWQSIHREGGFPGNTQDKNRKINTQGQTETDGKLITPANKAKRWLISAKLWVNN